jgi:magnesium chelatase family protein
MLAVGPIFSRIPIGLNAHSISIECHIAPGLPGTTIVGLAEGAVKEPRDRVKSALRNNGSTIQTAMSLSIWPRATLRKVGQVLIYLNGENTEFIGELGLFGELRGINGILTCALASTKANRALILTEENEQEASLVKTGSLLVAPNLAELAKYLNGQATGAVRTPIDTRRKSPPIAATNYAQIVGQLNAKRGLLIAAAGGHHLIMLGPPGAGKTMLARSFVELLPKLKDQPSLEVATIYSSIGLERADHTVVPFRDPHHSISSVAMVGGDQRPQPGEVALAHKGVLFLHELPHFKPATFDLLRGPIENGYAAITRAKYRVSFPCEFQLIAAMNPCPAGRSCNTDAAVSLANNKDIVAVFQAPYWIELTYIFKYQS